MDNEHEHQTPNEYDDLLTAKEVAAWLVVAVSGITKLVQAGLLRHIDLHHGTKRYKQLRFTRPMVEEYLHKGTKKAPSTTGASSVVPRYVKRI